MVHANESAVQQKTIVETQFVYKDLCSRFEAVIGRLDAPAIRRMEATGAPWEEIEATISAKAGESGLMQLAVFDQGAVASLAGSRICCRL
jgi:hypothetical protein